MDPFVHPDLARLARVICALRQGETITLPFVPHTRGEISEQIRLGAFRAGDPDEILHRCIHRTRSGREMTSRYEPVEWSLDDLMAMSADWPAEVLDALPRLDSIVDAPCYAILRRLDAGETVVFSGTRLVVEAREPDEQNACRVAIASSAPINTAYNASELAAYMPQ